MPLVVGEIAAGIAARADGARADLRRTVRRGSFPAAHAEVDDRRVHDDRGRPAARRRRRRDGPRRPAAARAHRARSPGCSASCCRSRAASRSGFCCPDSDLLDPSRRTIVGAAPGRRAQHLGAAGHRQDAARPRPLQVGRRPPRDGRGDDRRRRRVAGPLAAARTGARRRASTRRRSRRRSLLGGALRGGAARRRAPDHRRGAAPRGARGGAAASGRVLSLVILLALFGAAATQAIGLHADLRRLRRRAHRGRVFAHQRADARGDRGLRRQRLRSGLLRVDRAARRLRRGVRPAPLRCSCFVLATRAEARRVQRSARASAG